MPLEPRCSHPEDQRWQYKGAWMCCTCGQYFWGRKEGYAGEAVPLTLTPRGQFRLNPKPRSWICTINTSPLRFGNALRLTYILFMIHLETVITQMSHSRRTTRLSGMRWPGSWERCSLTWTAFGTGTPSERPLTSGDVWRERLEYTA